MDLGEEIREFLIESNENLSNLDREIVRLEQNPGDIELISSAFRTIHTIKGTCGFFGYSILGSVTHITETILSQVREGQRQLTPPLISLVLEAVDAVKTLLTTIESTGAEGEDLTSDLRRRLEQAQRTGVDWQQHATSSPADTTPEELSPVQKLESVTTVVALSVAAEQPAAEPLPENRSDGSQQLPAAKPASSEAGQDTALQLAESSIRVDVALLNRLMNLVGELVLARNQLLQDASSQHVTLQQTSQRLNLITSELQESVMKTRMQPIGVVWNKLPRIVRDLAAQCGKKIRIDMEGAGTELDKTIIEAIKDPLTHIVRNSCDHGIEMPELRLNHGKRAEGLLTLRAYHEGGVVNIEISDDGAGIDTTRVKKKALERGLISAEQATQMSERDALHLIFMPGFSTAEQVTSISGRGVGMDVVKTNIEKIGGSVEVQNRPGGGTTLRIKIPLTLAIIPGLLVTLGAPQASEITHPGFRTTTDERFIIPQANLLELVRLEGQAEMKKIEIVHGTPILHHRGRLLPLIYLRQVLRRGEPSSHEDIASIVILQAENRQIGLVVDRICDTQEIVVKPLGRQLKSLTWYVGATIMGDGRPALILDIAGLSRLAGLSFQTRTTIPSDPIAIPAAHRSQMLLLFRAGRFKHIAVPLALVDRLEEVSIRNIELAAGRPVLHYCGEILPLLELSTILEPGVELDTRGRATISIIVFANGRRRFGLIVDQIVDIVTESITVRHKASATGLMGSALVGGRITDMLDLHALTARLGEDWLDASSDPPAQRTRVLLVDSSTVAREMIHEFLEVAGYEVIPASTAAEALPKMQSVDIVITTPSAGEPFRALIGLDSTQQRIPLLEILERSDTGPTNAADKFAMTGIQVARSDRSALLHAVATLTQRPMPKTEVLL